MKVQQMLMRLYRKFDELTDVYDLFKVEALSRASTEPHTDARERDLRRLPPLADNRRLLHLRRWVRGRSVLRYFVFIGPL